MGVNSILPDRWKVPEEFRARLGAQAGRQRPMSAEGHLLLVLHAPPAIDEAERVGRFFWRTPEGTWTSNEMGSGIAGLNKQLDEYEERIAALDQKEHDAKTAEDYFAVLEELTPLHRATRNLYQVLQEARKLRPDLRELIDVRDRAYSIERMAELLVSGTNNALEFSVARRAEEQARSSQHMAVAAHRLNILAAFFFPIITLAAILSVEFAVVADNFGIAESSLADNGTLIFAGIIGAGLVIGGIMTRMIGRAPQI